MTRPDVKFRRETKPHAAEVMRRPPPLHGSAAHLTTASLRKYKTMIDRWGGWGLFQGLLATLRRIADQHKVSIANVAVRAILDRPAVAGVIIGARLGTTEHITDNHQVFTFSLTDENRAEIAAALRPARNLMEQIGDCGDEYRPSR